MNHQKHGVMNSLKQFIVRIGLGTILWRPLSGRLTVAITASITLSFTGAVSHADTGLFPTFNAGQTLSESCTFEWTTHLTNLGN